MKPDHSRLSMSLSKVDDLPIPHLPTRSQSWQIVEDQIKHRPVEFLGRQSNWRRGTHKSKCIIQIEIHKKIKNCINSEFPVMSQLEQAW